MDDQMTSDRITRKEAVSQQPLSRTFVQEAWDLAVYKKAYKISLEVHSATKKFPRDERFELAGQMRRCSKGICANLAEGFAKQPFSKAEFKRFIAMAIGSAAEMQVWSQYACDLEYISESKANEWKSVYKDISRMLQRLHMNV